MIIKDMKDEARWIKQKIRIFFHGDPDWNIEPIYNMGLVDLGICNFGFSFRCDICTISVYLRRPGLLIGKKGELLDMLLKYLNETTDWNVKIKIFESDPWS
jgi:ribosomal protein S3